MNNSTNITSAVKDEEPMTVWQMTVAALSALFCLCSIIAYILYIVIVAKNRKSRFSNAFYSFTISLGVIDSCVNCIMLFYTLAMNMGVAYETWPFFVHWLCGFSMDVTWFALSFHLAIIGTNRLVAIVWYNRYKFIFSKPNVCLIIFACYCLACVIPIGQYICGCAQVFKMNTWFVECPESTCGDILLTLDNCVSNGMVVYVVLANVLIVFFARRASKRFAEKRKAKQGVNVADVRAVKERSLLLQCVAVSSILFMYNTSFWIMQSINDKNLWPRNTSAVVLNLMFVLNSGLAPFVYFACSSEVRRQLFKQKVAVNAFVKVGIVQANAVNAFTVCKDTVDEL